MSRSAKIYIAGVMLVGLTLVVLALPSARQSLTEWTLVLVLTILATVAHLYMSDTISHEAWAVNLVFLFVGVILLTPFDFALLVLIPHLIEWGYEVWIKKSNRLRNLYIQPYNIVVHLIAGFAARAVFLVFKPASASLIAPEAFAAALVAIITYLLINHLLIGLVLMLARRVTLRQSGVFELTNLLSDFLQFGLGYIVAVLWQLNPLLILPAAAPLVMMYRAIQVPKLSKEAHTDAKTGLWNMRHFNDLFAAELDRARRFGRPLSVVMADLDLLRNINNTYGHLAGDAVLTRIGEIIRNTVRSYDIAARFGGEEFSIVLLEATVEDGRSFASRLRHAIESAEFVIPTSPQPIHVTMSLGVASFPADATTQNELIHLADVAVYQAKLHGRNCVVCASDVPRSVTLDDSRTEPAAESSYRAAFATQSAVVPPPAAATQTVEAAASTSKSQTAPQIKPRRFRPTLRLFIIAIVGLGLIITTWGMWRWPVAEPIELGWLILMAIAAETLLVSVYGFSTVSISVSIIFAAGLTAGVPGAAAASAAVAVTHYLRVRPHPYQTTFNWAAHVIAGAMPALATDLFRLQLNVDNLPVLLLAAVGTGILYYGLETGLVAAAIGLSEGQPILGVWYAQFRWLIYNYLALCVMGMFLAIAFNTLGLAGVIVFALPPFMMHFTQKQYVERTEESVRELRRMNHELTRANQEIVSASRAIQSLNDELFLVLAKIVDARDPFVSGHTTKVADYAVAVAQELALPEARVESIRQAALLHDIGKIGISEEILHKPDRLSLDEYRIVKNHTLLGAELLDTCQGLRHLAPHVKHHHEWWDGSGYPDHLKGEAIPLEARILAVCDAVEAMASDRPYSRARSMDQISVELQRCAGTQFDPAIVAVFVKVAQRIGGGFVVNSAREVVQRQANGRSHTAGLNEPAPRPSSAAFTAAT